MWGQAKDLSLLPRPVRPGDRLVPAPHGDPPCGCLFFIFLQLHSSWYLSLSLSSSVLSLSDDTFLLLSVDKHFSPHLSPFSVFSPFPLFICGVRNHRKSTQSNLGDLSTRPHCEKGDLGGSLAWLCLRGSLAPTFCGLTSGNYFPVLVQKSGKAP